MSMDESVWLIPPHPINMIVMSIFQFDNSTASLLILVCREPELGGQDEKMEIVGQEGGDKAK
ncbi:unnamed protein product [Onchocerca flexuosa]|uniref:Ovule protein n=1 Tax=Onchocerca flexuosa TaxID=387005 RepID=A0A183HSI2_9BILA|nr:unnamed protein product [Onchocerca flexuosa]